MTESDKAVFLSYASQDAEPAGRISLALRSAGIEVWFDRSELRGGDAWDHKIRRQIRDCALFMPVISANTAARAEGYFRLEWSLAEQRSQMIARNKAFIVPVCLDATPESGADVPEAFQQVQWTRLPDGAMPPSFAARIAALLAAPGEAAVATTARAEPSPAADAVGAYTKRNLRRNLIVIGSAGLAVIFAAYVAVDRVALSGHGAGKRTVAALASIPDGATAPIAERSVAVLPFIDMSERKDQEYFSDGLSEELIDRLTRLSDLRVPARTSSFFFKGKQTTIGEVARALGVAHVLEGSVRKSGATLRVTAQLIRADNGYHVWSQSYDRKLDDIFKVQDEIADDVVKALSASLLGHGTRSAAPVVSPEAYNLFLQGRYFAARRTVADMTSAIEYFGKATKLDPAYAEAWAALAFADAWQAQFGDQDVDALTARARAAAERAIRLKPMLPEPHATMAMISTSYDFDWAQASAEINVALSLDHRNPDALLLAGQNDFTFGRTDEAIARFRDVLAIDPLRGDAYLNLGSALYSAGRFEEAGDLLRAAMKIHPEQVKSHFLMAMIEVARGDSQAARATIEAEQAAWYRLTGLAIIEHALGHRAESDAALAKLRAGHSGDAAVQIAEAYACRGELNEAFAWLDRAHRQRDAGLRWLKVDRLFAALRSDGRYKAFLHRMNLPE